jgi:septum site-determining protein MinD
MLPERQTWATRSPALRGSRRQRRQTVAARVITITSGKGGVGKTTTTANLAVSLGLLGQRVVAVDADIGLRNLDVVMGLENRVVYDLVDVVEGRCRLRQAMIRDKRLSEVYLLPAAQTRDKTAVNPAQMADLCNQLRPDFDFVLVDSPAGIEQGFQNAVAGADEIVIVTTPEVSAVRDADRIIGLVEAGEKGPARLIVNRIKAEMVRRGDMLDVSDVLEILRIDLVGVVPEDEHIIVSTNKGSPVAHEGGVPAAQAFRNIAKRLLGEDVPFLIIDSSTNLFDRLRRLIK